LVLWTLRAFQQVSNLRVPTAGWRYARTKEKNSSTRAVQVLQSGKANAHVMANKPEIMTTATHRGE
jgi:hypothetical protein